MGVYLAQQQAGLTGGQVSRSLIHIQQSFALHLLLKVPPVLLLTDGRKQTFEYKRSEVS